MTTQRLEALHAMRTKICKECKAELPLTEFYIHPRITRSNHRDARCHPCRRARAAALWRRLHSKPREQKTRTQLIVERLFNRCTLNPVNSCLEFPFALTGGYGQVQMPDRRRCYSAHRLAWEYYHGPIPDGLWVLHKCDNKICVLREHLFLGTHCDNMADCYRKGRLRPGSKLTPANVETIRSRIAAGEADRVIADDFNVRYKQIAKIRLGRAWVYQRRQQ